MREASSKMVHFFSEQQQQQNNQQKAVAERDVLNAVPLETEVWEENVTHQHVHDLTVIGNEQYMPSFL